jgi:predicted RecB family nuclease
VLTVGDAVGLPDFLIRAELLGSGRDGFEVVDAKLARSAKARAVLQTTYYSRLLADVQGVKPVRMHLALGGRDDLESFRVADFAAYERRVSQSLANSSSETKIRSRSGGTLPHLPVAIDGATRRREDDYLSLVAGISPRQRKALLEAGVFTLAQLGDLDAPPAIEGLGVEAFANTHAQARIQLKGRQSGRPEWEFRAPERDEDGALVPNRGLLTLPQPAEGDLFLDIEGARYYAEDGKTFGLQYLFGVVDTGEVDERRGEAVPVCSLRSDSIYATRSIPDLTQSAVTPMTASGSNQSVSNAAAILSRHCSMPAFEISAVGSSA